MNQAGRALVEAAERLRAAGVEAPAREARRLLALALGRPDALPDPLAPVPPGFAALVARRAAREPLALIRGTQGFWTLDLAVSSATLVPRADSETLIEAAVAAFPGWAAVKRVLDLGTGTGALLLAALVVFPDAIGIGIDRAPAAARLAAENAARNRLAARAAFAVGRWAEALAGATFDLVLANPPYIARAELATLMPEVRAHEPALALDGGPDGLEAYRAILPDLPRLLRPGGVAVLEVGAGQADAVVGLCRGRGMREVTRRADLSGIPRALVLMPEPAAGL